MTHGMPAPRADALLVLGGEDNAQRTRSRAAVRYYRDCQAAGLPLPCLVVTGAPAAHASGTSEAAWMARYLHAQGLPAAHVLQETQARDTLGNVTLGVALAARHGLRRLVLVSDDFHLRRSARLFQRVWGHAPTGCLGTGYAGTWRLRVREVLAFALQMAALRRCGVAPGNAEAHLRFVAARLAPH